MILLMPSRAGASLLLFCLEYKVDPKAVCQCPLGLVPHCYADHQGNFELVNVNMCQCPLGLVPHCYRRKFEKIWQECQGVNALSG